VKRIVVASSDKAYGDQAVLPYTEDAPLQGRHPYDVSKSCADLIAQAYATTYALPVAITRCGNFYGGGDLNWNRIVPGTIRYVLRRQRPVIRSDGDSVRDYFYVEDGAAAYMLLAEKLAANRDLIGHAFNFSNEVQLNVMELVQRISGLMGSDLEPDIRNEASNESAAMPERGQGTRSVGLGTAVHARSRTRTDHRVVSPFSFWTRSRLNHVRCRSPADTDSRSCV
jgi:CDP-glucose 4,6-dehydratase